MKQYALLVRTCASDIICTRRMFNRISSLNGWSSFAVVCLAIDNDLREEEVLHVLEPCVGVASGQLRIKRQDMFNGWERNQLGISLEIYKWACSFGLDVLKLDSDVFLADGRLFGCLPLDHPGLSGRTMPFFKRAMLGGEQIEFIQGGVVVFGIEARRWFVELDASDVTEFTNAAWPNILLGKEEKREEMKLYFTAAEDVVLLGMLPHSRGIPMAHIPRLQVSPYDLIADFKSITCSPEELLKKFAATKAMAYHFEGTQWGKRLRMNKYLLRCYDIYDTQASDCKTVSSR